MQVRPRRKNARNINRLSPIVRFVVVPFPVNYRRAACFQLLASSASGLVHTPSSAGKENCYIVSLRLFRMLCIWHSWTIPMSPTSSSWPFLSNGFLPLLILHLPNKAGGGVPSNTPNRITSVQKIKMLVSIAEKSPNAKIIWSCIGRRCHA